MMKFFERNKKNSNRSNSRQGLIGQSKEKSSGGGLLSRLKNFFKSKKPKAEPAVELTEEQKNAQGKVHEMDTNNLRDSFTRSNEYNNVMSTIENLNLLNEEKKNLVERVDNWISLVASDPEKSSYDFLEDDSVRFNLNFLPADIRALSAPLLHLSGKMDSIKNNNINDPENRPSVPKLLR